MKSRTQLLLESAWQEEDTKQDIFLQDKPIWMNEYLKKRWEQEKTVHLQELARLEEPVEFIPDRADFIQRQTFRKKLLAGFPSWQTHEILNFEKLILTEIGSNVNLSILTNASLINYFYSKSNTTITGLNSWLEEVNKRITANSFNDVTLDTLLHTMVKLGSFSAARYVDERYIEAINQHASAKLTTIPFHGLTYRLGVLCDFQKESPNIFIPTYKTFLESWCTTAQITMQHTTKNTAYVANLGRIMSDMVEISYKDQAFLNFLMQEFYTHQDLARQERIIPSAIRCCAHFGLVENRALIGLFIDELGKQEKLIADGFKKKAAVSVADPAAQLTELLDIVRPAFFLNMIRKNYSNSRESGTRDSYRGISASIINQLLKIKESDIHLLDTSPASASITNLEANKKRKIIKQQIVTIYNALPAANRAKLDAKFNQENILKWKRDLAKENIPTVGSRQHEIYENVKGSYPTAREEDWIDSISSSVDILIPAHKIVIQVDGPSHFYYGTDEANIKTRLNTSALEQNGYDICRVPVTDPNYQQTIANFIETLARQKEDRDSILETEAALSEFSHGSGSGVDTSTASSRKPSDDLESYTDTSKMSESPDSSQTDRKERLYSVNSNSDDDQMTSEIDSEVKLSLSIPLSRQSSNNLENYYTPRGEAPYYINPKTMVVEQKTSDDGKTDSLSDDSSIKPVVTTGEKSKKKKRKPAQEEVTNSAGAREEQETVEVTKTPETIPQKIWNTMTNFISSWFTWANISAPRIAPEVVAPAVVHETILKQKTKQNVPKKSHVQAEEDRRKAKGKKPSSKEK